MPRAIDSVPMTDKERRAHEGKAWWEHDKPDSKERAEASAERMTRRLGVRYVAYTCIVCGDYHIGRKKRGRGRPGQR